MRADLLLRDGSRKKSWIVKLGKQLLKRTDKFSKNALDNFEHFSFTLGSDAEGSRYAGSRMLLDRRGSDRRRSEPSSYKRLAKIQSNGSLPRDCIITDVSKSGATLIAETAPNMFSKYADVPAEFTVIFSTGHSVRCRLRWRNGYEFAVDFIDYVRRCRRGRRRRQRVAK